MRRFVIGCDSGKERMWHLDFLLEKVRETNGHDESSLKQDEKERKRMDAWSQKAERGRERDVTISWMLGVRMRILRGS